MSWWIANHLFIILFFSIMYEMLTFAFNLLSFRQLKLGRVEVMRNVVYNHCVALFRLIIFLVNWSYFHYVWNSLFDFILFGLYMLVDRNSENICLYSRFVWLLLNRNFFWIKKFTVSSFGLKKIFIAFKSRISRKKKKLDNFSFWKVIIRKFHSSMHNGNKDANSWKVSASQFSSFV